MNAMFTLEDVRLRGGGAIHCMVPVTASQLISPLPRNTTACLVEMLLMSIRKGTIATEVTTSIFAASNYAFPFVEAGAQIQS